MNNEIKVEIPVQGTIGLNSKVAFLGSCFSDNISSKFIENNLVCSGNPFETIFNPISLSKIIVSTLKNDSLKGSIFKSNDVYLNWNFNSKIFGLQQDELVQKVSVLQSDFCLFLENCSHLVLTLGTANIYRLKSDDSIVSSCHRMDKNIFDRQLLSIVEIEDGLSVALNMIREINPKIEILFTLSPVRYIRDGLTESQLSKSRLREAIFNLCERFGAQYFPAYEIVIDELRDYCFFEPDGVHPNSKAIDFVWDRFKATYFDSELMEYLDRLSQIKSRVNHRHLHPGSSKSIEFDMNTKKLVDKFNSDYLGNPFK